MRAETRSGRVRLEDVALAAGVAKSTASRILNDAPDLSVRTHTRARVLEAARRLDYRPHAAARGLRRAATGALGLVVPNLAMPVYARIVRGAFRRARERDFVVLLAEDLVPREADEAFAALAGSGRIDGLVVASARPRHPLVGSLRRHGIPHVFANRAVGGSGRNVVMDDARASAAALDHLTALGHVRIGHVAGPRTLDPARRRAEAFAAEAAARGLDEAPVAEGEFSEQGGAEPAHALFDAHPGLTAVYSSSLAQTLGVLHAAWERGLRVPNDVSVVSYDDMPFAAFLRPPVTTIRMPLGELGAAAVDALIDQLEGAEPRDVVVPGEPVVIARRSTAPPRG